MNRLLTLTLSLCILTALSLSAADTEKTSDKTEKSTEKQPDPKPVAPAKTAKSDKENPYAGLPDKKDFKMGELEEQYKEVFDQIESVTKSFNAVDKCDQLDFYHYARRMEYFAGHPYIEEAVKIKSEWMIKVSKVMRFFFNNRARLEIAQDAKNKAMIKKYSDILENARVKFVEFIKTPDKIEKKEDAPSAGSSAPKKKK